MKSKSMNTEIRTAMKAKNVYNYEVAQQLQINPVSFGRWMQRELTPEKKQLVLDAIARAAAEG